jgi:hypothetical protein
MFFWLLIDGTGDLDCEQVCSLGSLRRLLDNNEKVLPIAVRLSLALQVRGMTYLHNQGSTYYSSRLEESQYL